MKKAIKYLLITTLAALLGFGLVACDFFSKEEGGSAPDMPSGLAVTEAETSTNSITISWDAVPGAVAYIVERREGTSGSFIQADAPAATTHTSTGLSPGTGYSFRVAAFNTHGQSAWTTAVSGTTKPEESTGGLGAPTGLTVTTSEITTNSITITWTAVTGAASYVVERQGGTSETFAEVDTLTGTTHTSTELTPDTSYTFRVAAVNSEEQSSWSTVSATTLAAGKTDVLSGYTYRFEVEDEEDGVAYVAVIDFIFYNGIFIHAIDGAIWDAGRYIIQANLVHLEYSDEILALTILNNGANLGHPDVPDVQIERLPHPLDDLLSGHYFKLDDSGVNKLIAFSNNYWFIWEEQANDHVLLIDAGSYTRSGSNLSLKSDKDIDIDVVYPWTIAGVGEEMFLNGDSGDIWKRQ